MSVTLYDKIINSANIHNTADFQTKMDLLHGFLYEYNKNVNLTRIVEYDDYMTKHVCDSLFLGIAFKELTEKKLSVCDIGCGAGFPSLVLAAAYPHWSVTAVDSIGKKTTFVQLAAEKLGLKNINVVTGRTNELNRKTEWKKRFDIVTARAVATAKTVYNDARNFPKDSGRFILYKTPEQLKEDLPEIKSAASNRKWQITPVFELPGDAGSRQFLFY